MLHSGSRNIGNEVATRHIATAKSLHDLNTLPAADLAYFIQGTPEFKAYWHDLEWSQAYAMKNREIMMARLIRSFERRFGWSTDTPVRTRAEHADVLAGGTGDADKSVRAPLFYEPTVITGATNDMRGMREETFGPTLPIATIHALLRMFCLSTLLVRMPAFRRKFLTILIWSIDWSTKLRDNPSLYGMLLKSNITIVPSASK